MFLPFYLLILFIVQCRAIREFANKRGGIEQRNSYIASIKSKIEKFENVITGWKIRMNVQHENRRKLDDDYNMPDAEREEKKGKCNELIEKYRNVSDASSRISCCSITNTLLCF